jgi:heme-degrading monooxygenase HmoA
MIQIVWQFEVKEESRGRFELAYGPGGPWSSLFAKAPGYRGTALLRDTEDPRKYLTIDAWDTEEHHRGFLSQHREEHDAVDAGFRELILSEARVGAYKLLAEATVRPAPKPGTSRTSRSRRSR